MVENSANQTDTKIPSQIDKIKSKLQNHIDGLIRSPGRPYEIYSVPGSLNFTPEVLPEFLDAYSQMLSPDDCSRILKAGPDIKRMCLCQISQFPPEWKEPGIAAVTNGDNKIIGISFPANERGLSVFLRGDPNEEYFRTYSMTLIIANPQ